MQNSQKRATKVPILTLLHYEHGLGCRIPTSPSSYMCALVGRDMHANACYGMPLSELPHQQIFQGEGDHFHHLQQGAVHLAAVLDSE